MTKMAPWRTKKLIFPVWNIILKIWGTLVLMEIETMQQNWLGAIKATLKIIKKIVKGIQSVKKSDPNGSFFQRHSDFLFYLKYQYA